MFLRTSQTSFRRSPICHLFLVLLILLPSIVPFKALAQQPGADGLGDRLYPQLGNGGYDVLHYDISLRFTPEKNHIAATTVITATATEDLSSFNLDLYGLSVESLSCRRRACQIRAQ